MPISLVLAILDQICDALSYAHDVRSRKGELLGIIHRDVSPSNIILSDRGVVKLIDFGIARARMVGPNTSESTIKGKFSYIAPEYVIGNDIDRRADLFAVGVIAHELVTNRLLFKADNDLDTLHNVREMPIDRPSRINPQVSADLDAIIMTALARDPDQRWQNAEALRTALGHIPRRDDEELAPWVAALMADNSRRSSPAVSTPRPDEPSIEIQIVRAPTMLPAIIPAALGATPEAEDELMPFHDGTDHESFATTNAVVELWSRKRTVSPWLVVLLLVTLGAAAAYYFAFVH